MTAALYDGDFAALSSLSQSEMRSVFNGAKVQEILLDSGMTVLDLVLKAKIYKHDRKPSIGAELNRKHSYYMIIYIYS